MLEAAVIAVRFLQYAGAAVLFGSPLFFVYAGEPAPRVARAMVASAAVLLALASALEIGAQSSLFAG